MFRHVEPYPTIHIRLAAGKGRGDEEYTPCDIITTNTAIPEHHRREWGGFHTEPPFSVTPRGQRELVVLPLVTKSKNSSSEADWNVSFHNQHCALSHNPRALAHIAWW